MAKVLISFLGTGVPTERHYKEVSYVFPGGKTYSSPFFAKALSQYYNIDRIILIGTVKSMWEAVYEEFAKMHDCFDENTWFEIGDVCEKANHSSPLELPHKDKIENALGKNSKAVLIKYGINSEEIRENMDIILNIESYLNNGDELYIDITHSFRSLPLFLMNCINYVKDVSKKNISIKHINYGMLDVAREFKNEVPVVDLTEMLNVTEWISGAYSFLQFGNAYKISKQIETIDKDAAKRLVYYSDAKNLNYLSALKNATQNISGLNTDNLPLIAQKVLYPIVEDARKQISRQSNCTNAQKQYDLAKWHFDRLNYSASFLTLTEAVITLISEKERMPCDSEDDSKQIKSVLYNEYPEIFRIYRKANDCRRQIAHSVEGAKNVESMIKILSECITYLKPFFYPQ